MDLSRRSVLVAIAFSFIVPACSGLRLSPVTPEPTSHWIPGKFIWHDLITHDVEAVKTFYGDLFGWTFEALPGTDRYTVIRHAGRMIGGIAFSDRRVDGRPVSQWVGLISVPNVDVAVSRIRQAGGHVYVDPRDIPDRGRLAVVGDPQGAVFGLAHTTGGDPPDRGETAIGDWLWNELWCDDEAAAARVYAEAVGYELDTREVAGHTYKVFEHDGEPRAGLLRDPFPDVTPNWLSYVRVTDPAALVARVEELGGQVLVKPAPEHRQGTVAVIADPTGAEVAIQKWPIEGATDND